MSADGAHLGLSAEAAMHRAIGGEPALFDPPPMTTQQMFERIMATEPTEEFHTYSGVSDYMAKLIIQAFRADPTLASAPTMNVYSVRDDGTTDYDTVRTPGLWTVLQERLDPRDAEFVSGMSIFMWGWAVNAARACIELPPVPNPAIVTFGGSQS